MLVLKAGSLYFALTFAAGWALGPIREFWVIPRLGRTAGFFLEAAPLHPMLSAIAAPGFGGDHQEIMSRFAHASGLIVLVIDGFLPEETGGTVSLRSDADRGFSNMVSSMLVTLPTHLEEPEAVLSHAGLPNKSLQEWGALGARIGRSQTRWAVGGLYQGEGSFQGLDATGAPTGSFSASSMAFGATMAQQIGKRVTLGLGAKGVREKLATVSGSGFTFDAGMMVRAGMFGFGFAAQNLGGQMRYGAASYPFPSNYGVGAAFTHRTSGVRIAVDANFPSAYHADVRTGVEWNHKGTVALRTGYRHELGSAADPLSGATFGLGAGTNGMWIDYGYLLSGDGQGQHRLGLRFNLGRLGLGDDALGQEDKPRDFDRAKDGSLIGPPVPRKR